MNAVNIDPFKRDNRIKGRSCSPLIGGKKGKLGVNLIFTGSREQESEKIKTQQGEVCQIVFRERLVFQVRVDKTEAAHDSFTKGVIAQLRYDDPFFIADDDIFDTARTVNKESNLTTEFSGEFDQAGSKLKGAEFSNRYPPPVETLQRLDLT